MITTALIGSLAAIPAVLAGVIYSRSTKASKATNAFFNPVDGGGSWLDNAGSGGGEPLNVSALFFHPRHLPLCSLLCFQVIVSGFSTPAVLTDDGLLNYARAIGL